MTDTGYYMTYAKPFPKCEREGGIHMLEACFACTLKRIENFIFPTLLQVSINRILVFPDAGGKVR
jgi:hypothetical protein